MKNKLLIAVLVFTLLFLLFFFPDSSFTGAKNGLLLWFNIILPTLLPFIIVSNLMIGFQIVPCLCSFFSPLLCRLLPISKEGCYPILVGMLSGYPVGAKACADLVKGNRISEAEGQFLLSFCNNASPMFITGYIARQCMNLPQYRYRILAVLLTSAFLSSFLYYLLEHLLFYSSISALEYQPIKMKSPTHSEQKSDNISLFQILDTSILNGFEIMVKIGGYIILLSFIAQIIYDLPFFPVPFKSFLVGILEITTGSAAVAKTTISSHIKIVLITAITGFGGLSSLAQTQSVISNSGLSIKKYIICKLLNGFWASLLAYVFL